MKRLRPFITLLIFFVCIAPPLESAAMESDKDTVERVKLLSSHLNSLTSLTFNFTQRTSGQMSGRPRQASGQAFLIRMDNGAKMRWNYLVPDKQVIISDGKKLSMYFEKLNQMIISPADVLQEDITYSFFTGKQNISDNFFILSGIDEQDLAETASTSLDVVKLVPKASTSQIKGITLWLSSKNEIKRIEILDSFDTITLLTLSNVAENSLYQDGIPVNSGLFTFAPPEGTEIIRQ